MGRLEETTTLENRNDLNNFRTSWGHDKDKYPFKVHWRRSPRGVDPPWESQSPRNYDVAGPLNGAHRTGAVDAWYYSSKNVELSWQFVALALTPPWCGLESALSTTSNGQDRRFGPGISMWTHKRSPWRLGCQGVDAWTS